MVITIYSSSEDDANNMLTNPSSYITMLGELPFRYVDDARIHIPHVIPHQVCRLQHLQLSSSALLHM